MEVTRKNFREALPEIEETIKRCAFLAIDGEFTGLSSGLEKTVSSFDSPTEYYQKLRNGSLDFLFVQFGLAAFMYNEDENKYTHRAFNFYLFPKPLSRNSPDCRFLCQASSLDFLASHGFDFNKLFREGIPYLNVKDEFVLKTRQDEARERRKSGGKVPQHDIIDCPPEHEKTVKNAFISVDNFLSNQGEAEELTLPPANGYIRKLIYQEIYKKYKPEDLQISSKGGAMIIKRVSSNPEEDEERIVKEEEMALEEAVGFSRVIKLMSESRKLIVGHNMLLDLCHIVHRFCHPLPESYEEFKTVLHCVFPSVMDTKFMCSTRPIIDEVPSSVLPHLLDTVQKPPFSLLKLESEDHHAYSTLDLKEHEAGFDAYITGVIAIALSNFVATKKKLKCTGADTLPSSSSKHLQEYINRLYLMKVIDCYIQLNGDDPKLNREAVFHVTFPEDWKTSDLTNLFSPYGGIQISWLTRESAYIGLYDRIQAVNVKKQLCASPHRGVTVTPYHTLHNREHQSPVRAMPKQTSSTTATATTVKTTHPRRSSLESRGSLKRPSVESIPEEPEETEHDNGKEFKTVEKHTKKRRKLEENEQKKNMSIKTNATLNLFEENSDWK